MDSDIDYLAYLTAESARFAEAVRRAAPQAPVPSCPAWNADDLLWHLAEVQCFWGNVVRENLAGDEAGKLIPARPADRAALLAFYERASRDLAGILAAADPAAHAWTWSAEQTVGFIRRRQAHEALIHRVDAELAAGHRTPLDARLAADGVDEALRVMYGGVPDWGTFTPASGLVVRLRATDTGGSWLVTLGRFTGTDPGDGTSYDEPGIDPAETDSGEPALAEITGSAADLDCWLWHRPGLAAIGRAGDPGVIGGFEAAIAPGID